MYLLLLKIVHIVHKTVMAVLIEIKTTSHKLCSIFLKNQVYHTDGI